MPQFKVVVQWLSRVQLCNPMNCTTPGFPVLHCLPELAQTHVHWASDAIQPSPPLSPPSSPVLSLFQHQGLFQWVDSLHLVAKVLEFQLKHQSFQWIFRIDSFRIDWFDLLAVQRTLKSLLQRHNSNASILPHSAFFMVQLSHSYMTTGKTIALTIQTFVGKMMSLLFNMLSRFLIAFLPRSKCLLISWLQSPSAVILEPKKIKSVTISTFSPTICLEVMGLDAMILVFWMLSFKPVFSLSCFTFIKRFFCSSLLSVIRVVSSAYLRLLLFLPAILIASSESSSPAFHMMYSAYKFNKQGDNIQPWHIPFPILNQSLVPCLVLTVASWPAYKFQRNLYGDLLFPSHKNFPQFVVIHTVKGFSVANEAEVVGVFFAIRLLFLWSNRCWQFDLWFLCLFEIQLVHLEVISSGTVEP